MQVKKIPPCYEGLKTHQIVNISFWRAYMKKETWLVVANNSMARIFKVQKKESLIEIETLIHPESRLYNRDLRSDKPGRSYESANATRHSVGEAVMPKQLEFAIFAKEIATYLDQARRENKFDRLYIAAGPTQLGLLRQKLNGETSKLVGGEVDIDITHLQSHEIIAHLPFIL